MKKFKGLRVVRDLLDSYRADKLPFINDTGLQFPEIKENKREIAVLKEILFPNYWNAGLITKYGSKLEAKINKLGHLFFNGMKADVKSASLESLKKKETNLKDTVDVILNKLGTVREELKKDVVAANKGDPAAKSFTEIIRSYPGFEAIMIHRVAHLIYSAGFYSYARELSEYIHSKTGIDIHPGAKIGEYFFIDHGTGVVIGETTEIGDWVRIYQDVTLGVLHFEKNGDVSGILKKEYRRHPKIENHVVIGAGAKILGPVRIGSHVNIGANSWIIEDIPDRMTVFAEHPKLQKRNIPSQKGGKSNEKKL